MRQLISGQTSAVVVAVAVATAAVASAASRSLQHALSTDISFDHKVGLQQMTDLYAYMRRSWT